VIADAFSLQGPAQSGPFSFDANPPAATKHIDYPIEPMGFANMRAAAGG
jgi:hypothetical protein